MIRAFLTLLPPCSGAAVTVHLVLTVLGLLLRAAGVVLLVPLVAALFSGTPASAWVWLAALAAVTVVGWIVDMVAARRAFALGFGVLDSGQRTVADRVSRVRLGWFDAQNTATTRQAIAATGPDLVGIVIYLVTPLITSVLLPIAIAIALVPIAWQLTVAALAGVPLLLAVFWLAGRIGRGADQVAADANSALTERIVEFARTQQALRASRRVKPARSHAGEALEAQHGASMRLLLLQIPGQVLFGIVSQIVLILLAGTVVVLTLNAELSVPAAIALIVVIVRYLEPFTVLAELSPGLIATVGALRRIRTVHDAPVAAEGTGSLALVGAPRVQLRGIRFGYGATGGAPYVLDGLDLELEPGTTTAIVGPSGSGKSTILALLAGLRDPDAGTILVDGVDVATLDAHARRALVSMVFQHPYLFDGSLRENVLVGDPDAVEESLTKVAELSRVDSIVARLSDGWDSRVGEAGTTLSGGERQRASIARALLKQAPILLVDEATSALDAENESAVAAALTDDPVARTRVIVAHRLSSIRAADRVLFVEDGRIVEDGTIEDLLALEGRFAQFWQRQDAAGAWRLGAAAGSVD